MTQPEKESVELKESVETTTEENVPTPETNAEGETSEESLDGDQQKNIEGEEAEVDYKAALEKERAEKESYKKMALKKDRQVKELKEQTDLSDESVVEEIIDRVKGELGQFQTSMVETVFEDELNAVSSNDDEKQLILHYYENVLQRSGTSRSAIKRDLDLAKVLANKEKVKKRTQTLEHAARVKQTTQSVPNFNGQKLKETPPSNLAPELKRFSDAMDRLLAKYK